MSHTYRVSGMTCGHCAGAVTEAIVAAAPQAHVPVNLDQKTVTVEGVGDEAVVAQAVADAGYQFEGRVEG